MEKVSKFLVGQTKLKKLSLTSNVTQKLFADETFVESCRCHCEAPLEAIKLKSLKQMDIKFAHDDGITSIFPFFAGAQLERFHYEDDCEMNELEMEKFSKFLIGQTKLRKSA
jgi:hypothetical protein